MLNSDSHLNIFWHYNVHPTFENNITKAIINFLQYADLNTQLEFVDFFCEGKCPYVRDRIEIRYGLQRLPDNPKSFNIDFL
jgi:hypothetical protein